MYMPAGVYLPEKPDPPPPLTHCLNTYPCTYSHREGGGVGAGKWTIEKVRGVENTNMTHCISTAPVYKLY